MHCPGRDRSRKARRLTFQGNDLEPARTCRLEQRLGVDEELRVMGPARDEAQAFGHGHSQEPCSTGAVDRVREQVPTGPYEPCSFAEERLRIVDVLEHVGQQHQIGAAVGERRTASVASGECGCDAGSVRRALRCSNAATTDVDTDQSIALASEGHAQQAPSTTEINHSTWVITDRKRPAQEIEVVSLGSA